MTTNKESYRENPGLQDEIHCIVYVLKVDRPDIHGDEKSKALYDEIADVRKQFTPDSKLPFKESEFAFQMQGH